MGNIGALSRDTGAFVSCCFVLLQCLDSVLVSLNKTFDQKRERKKQSVFSDHQLEFLTEVIHNPVKNGRKTVFLLTISIRSHMTQSCDLGLFFLSLWCLGGLQTQSGLTTFPTAVWGMDCGVKGMCEAQH